MQTKSITLMVILLCSMTIFGQSNVSDNKEAVRIFIEEVWNKRDFKKLEVIFSDSVVFHVHNITPVATRKSQAEEINKWHVAFPDFKYTIHQIIGEGDFVSVNLQYAGTHQSYFLGIVPSYNRISASEMFFVRLKDTRIVEIWGVYDLYLMKEQMLKTK